MTHKITYYPVDNGDQSLIEIDENNYLTQIMVDCNLRETAVGTSNPDLFDVKADLEKRLKKRTVNDLTGVMFTDIFILTHGDDDHLHGFEKNFYQGDPKEFKQKNKDNKEIVIDVLWFSPMIMGTAANDDERCFNKEAKRRIKLHREKSADRDLPGNRIIIIGKDANENLSGLDLVRKVPGEIVSRFNNRDLKLFSIFIHSPYQEHLSDEEVDKNRVSVVFQARFKATFDSTEFINLSMFGGDSDHVAWATILEKTKKHKNDVNQQALKWDLFLACHHCSWSFFNNTPYDQNKTPVATSQEVLENRRQNAKVIASSKEIKNDDDNPPHYQAKSQYVAQVKEANFLNTATNSKIGRTPQPIVFEITNKGLIVPKVLEGTATVTGTSATSPVKQPSSYGSGIA
ncbi:MAG: cobyric acid synthase CobQ [Bacteroidota bacterium]